MRAPSLVLAFLSLLAGCDRTPSGVLRGPPASGPAGASHPLPSTVPKDLTLPATRATTPLPGDALVVVISRSRLALGANGPTLAPVDPSRWELGLDGRYKKGGERGLLILPLAAALAARGVADAGAAPPVVIAADASVSYAVLTEVVFTLGSNSVNNISLLGRSGAGIATAAITLPQRGANGFPASTGSEPGLDLTVTIDDTGFAVSARGERMAPGCRARGTAAEGGGAATVPKADGSFDDIGLATCAATIKGSAPSTSDTSATLFAEPGSDVQSVIGAVDALRGENGALFPHVALGLVRR